MSRMSLGWTGWHAVCGPCSAQSAVERSSAAHAVLTRAAGRHNPLDAATAVLLEALAYRPAQGGGVGTALLDLLAREQKVSGSGSSQPG